MGFALFGISAPVFWLGLMGLFIFWFKLGWTAGTGYVPLTQSPSGWAAHLLLPWIVLALLYAAIYARMVRGNLLDAMGEDFIRTARAKGLAGWAVLYKHALRNALIPVVTLIGLNVGVLFTGAVVIETLFGLPGLGAFLVTGILKRDYPIVQGAILFISTFLVLVNLSVDLLYRAIDPRLRRA
jgi:peptide/nickel transport system permease protein